MKNYAINEDEQIHGVYRKHPLAIMRRILVSLAFVIGAFFLLRFDNPWAIYTSIVIGGIAFLKIIYELIIWYYDIYVITSHRLINIDQKGVFSRQISEAPLDKVQNVTHKTEGFMQTVFGYGTVLVQTAALELAFEHVSSPADVQQMIQDLARRSENADS